ncbi:LPS-assembly protein LptD [Natronospira bacteriovora]|uniref:LPS-assembly protein LptD n=1 Tax=Natronospira bacteriovora TaxID=3069753 RepID=A0ABU0W420_9GAMM|nr:LPS-assembly protein LptD [Natronospira sp. AB-CW4]MDQ2068769.1 LPS-assembly protein LptD [Natronospira sp. AB-CW4]
MQPRPKPDRHCPEPPPASASWLLLLVLLLPATTPAMTLEREEPQPWRLCPAWPPERPPETIGPPPTAETPVDIEADEMDGVLEEYFVYRGDVILRQGTRQLRAEELLYLPQTQEARVRGDVSFLQNDLAFSGVEASFDLGNDSGVFDQAGFRLLDRHARGEAGQLVRQDENTTLLEDLFYTTCPDDNRDWALNARRMHMDHDSGRGVARHLWLEFKGVPFFYSPWLSFPLDDRRKSGFLFPDFGRSERHGTEIALPFYWNIHPQLDSLLTPHHRSERGTQLYTETRYLTRSTRGSLQADYLPDDSVFGDDRYYLQYRQSTRLPANWRVAANIQRVSDTEYFLDLDDSPGARSRTHLPQSLTISQNTDWYRFQSRFRIFQTIDDAIEDSRLPYRELPDMRLDSDLPIGGSGFHAELGNRFTRFERADSLEADRLHLHPRITGRFGTPGWFVQPSIGGQYTRYDLNNPTAETRRNSGAELEPGEDRTLTRSAPVFSLDSGLILERPFADSLHLRQTLEPRLFYLYVPYRDQSAFPRFDTREMDFTFASLFMEDRFIGPDRLGDANQVGVALTSRVLDSRSGRSLLTGSLGQIHHFDDREVGLGSGDPVTTQRSELVGEVQLAPTEAFSARTTVLWDPEDRQTQRSAIQFQYRPEARKVLNLGYRNRRDRLDQVDFSFAWPITDRIRAFGRWNHSLQDDETLERFGGLEYESCCWALRFTTRRHIYNRDGDVDRSFMIQLELKGLGGVGQTVDDFLDESIMGYGYRDYD